MYVQCIIVCVDEPVFNYAIMADANVSVVRPCSDHFDVSDGSMIAIASPETSLWNRQCDALERLM